MYCVDRHLSLSPCFVGSIIKNAAWSPPATMRRLKSTNNVAQRRIRKRAKRPMRCGGDVTIIESIITGGVGVPLTTGAPVTPGVALETPSGFVVIGIGVGTPVAGVVITGVG
jgi:hypothetical protein